MKRTLFAIVLALVMIIQMLPAHAAEDGSPILSVTAKTHVEDLGHTVDSFAVQFADGFDASGIKTSNIIIENNLVHTLIPVFADGVKHVAVRNNIMTIDVDPFLFNKGFVVSCVKDGNVLFSFTIDDVVSFTTDVVDAFEVVRTDELIYRVFKPDTDEKLPLVIWFHGAGECGDDTYKPLVDYRGAVSWAEPDYQAKNPAVVLVPQLPTGSIWDETTLGYVRAMADSLVAEGIVDVSRIYAVGFSAWQGTLWFSTYNVDFVAAALHYLYWHAYDPDPRTGDEWGGIGWDVIADAKLPLWSVISVSDPTGATEEMQTYHIPYQVENNPNFKYTIWSQAQMYDHQLFGFLLHHGWVPAVDNQEMIDWLFAQSR